MGGQQLPQEVLKEQFIGHNILSGTLRKYKEQNFIAYVNQDNLFGIAREMVKFLDNGESFMNYQPPLPYIEGINSTNTDKKEEALKR